MPWEANGNNWLTWLYGVHRLPLPRMRFVFTIIPSLDNSKSSWGEIILENISILSELCFNGIIWKRWIWSSDVQIVLVATGRKLKCSEHRSVSKNWGCSSCWWWSILGKMTLSYASCIGFSLPPIISRCFLRMETSTSFHMDWISPSTYSGFLHWNGLYWTTEDY